jgi:hypothetical protein
MRATVAITIYIDQNRTIDNDMQKISRIMLFENGLVTRVVLHYNTGIQDDTIQVDDMLKDVWLPQERVLRIGGFYVRIGGMRFVHMLTYPR